MQITKPRFDTDLLEDKEPLWAVILWNDEMHSQLEVVAILVKVMRFNVHKATTLMMIAHAEQKALVVATHRERAEMYYEQLTDFTLTVTLEIQ